MLPSLVDDVQTIPIVLFASSIRESSFNVQKIIDILELDNALDQLKNIHRLHIISNDSKMNNILVGLSGGNSTHPYPHCNLQRVKINSGRL